jgi:hypothetical protein
MHRLLRIMGDPSKAEVAEALLDTCQHEWLKKIKEEGRPAMSGTANHDMELKNSTLQHLFRLCCKTYALRERQVCEWAVAPLFEVPCGD